MLFKENICRSSYVGRLALRGFILGPLAYDVELASKAIVGLGTNETLLIELILGRPGHEIRQLKTAYKQRYGRDLVDDVKSDLSGSTKRSGCSFSSSSTSESTDLTSGICWVVFTMALNAQKPENNSYEAIDYNQVNSDVEELNAASKKKNDVCFLDLAFPYMFSSHEQIPFFEILINRSDQHLASV